MNKTFEHKFEINQLVETESGLIDKVVNIEYSYNGVFDFVSYRLSSDYKMYDEEKLKPYNPNKQEFEIIQEDILHINGTTKAMIKVKRNGHEYWYERGEFNKMFN